MPLTQPAAYDGYAFELLDTSAAPTAGPLDLENNPPGLTTSSAEFKGSAINEAAKYTEGGDPAVVGFASVDRRHHRLCRDNTPASEKEEVTIASIELMPARHPPQPAFWDFFPPLRFIKIIIDWFKTQKRLEEQERTKGGKRRRSNKAVRLEIPQEML